MSRFNGFRLYNGCPDSALAAKWKSRDDAIAEAKRLGYGITYFPVEGQWQGYRLSDYMDPTPFCPMAEDCLEIIKRNLKK